MINGLNTTGEKKIKMTQKQKTLFSVGLKLVIGVGLASNICIGLLLYVNITAFLQVAHKTNDLLEINEKMNDNLRSGITDLQNKFMEIPSILAADPADKILDWIKKNHQISQPRLLENRDSYRNLFKRNQRRDLAKGHVIVHVHNDVLMVSRGRVDANGEFMQTIEQYRLDTPDTTGDLQSIQGQIDIISKRMQSPDMLEQNVLALKNRLADEAIAAESARNEILYRVEEIQKKKADLLAYRTEKLNTIKGIAAAAVLINLGVLYLLVRIIVEKPLTLLTLAIEKVNRGKNTEIPFQKRKDRIGLLALSLKDFQTALNKLQHEDDRKQKQTTLINELIAQITQTVEKLQKDATALESRAVKLNELAADTERRTRDASGSIKKTTAQADTVCISARHLKDAVAGVSHQMEQQSRLVRDIDAVAVKSIQDIQALTLASSQINEITTLVKNIAKETKLLALNAKIEAVRSGEAGNGFAVVAREVRELSDQTETANTDITFKVDSIQKASHTMIDNTHKIESRLENLLETVRLISEAVSTQDVSTKGIAQSATATAKEMQNVSQAILQVQEAAGQTSGLAENVHSISGEVAATLSCLLEDTREKLSMISHSDTDITEKTDGIAIIPENETVLYFSGDTLPGPEKYLPARDGQSPEPRSENHLRLSRPGWSSPATQ